jgi:hypothetical protein
MPKIQRAVVTKQTCVILYAKQEKAMFSLAAVRNAVPLREHRRMSGDFFIFQQDSAPAYRARNTIELLRRETPDFIGPDLWPANSPDLNPVDYRFWGLIQERVYQKRHGASMT